MKKALVTGGAGFIGSHLVKALIDDDWQVTVVDDLSSGKLENLNEKVKFRSVLPWMIDTFLSKTTLDKSEVLVVTGDFTDPAVVYHLHSHGYTHVFHLAANPRVEFSVKNPATSTQVNLQKTVELMTACMHAKIDQFIFASSSAVYGQPSELPTPESHKASPTNPYGLQKYVVEQFLEMYFKLYGMNSVALRFANVYGPGSDGDSPYSTAIGSWSHKLKNKLPLRSDGDGEQSRDMIYVTDVANAMIFCANLYCGFKTFNVGTGEAYTNNEILSMLRQKVGNFEIEKAPERKGDVKKTLLDTQRLKFFGWNPAVDINEGLTKTLAWWDISK